MSDHRVLLIENPARLTVDLGRLRIQREGYPDAFVAPGDIAVVCLHHHTIQMSVHALRVLALAGAGVVVTDAFHHPCAWLLPTQGNGDIVRRLRQQMALDVQPRKAILWQCIVQARLRTQAANLRALDRKGALRLERRKKFCRVIRGSAKGRVRVTTGRIFSRKVSSATSKVRMTPSMHASISATRYYVP